MEPVALSVRTPDILERMSTALTIRGQQQGLAGQAAEVKSAQQSQQQRAALAEFAKNGGFERHIGEDGLPDLNGISQDQELKNAAGDQYLDVLGKVAGVRQQGLQNMQTLTTIRGDQRAAFGELMHALRGDPDVAADNDVGRQKINAGMVQFGEMYGPESYPVLASYSKLLQGTPKGKIGDALKVVGMQAQAVGQQMEAQQPRYADTGPNLQQISPNALPSAPATITKGVAPGVQILTDQAGAQFAFDPQKNRVTPVGTGKTGGGTGPAPSASPTAPTFKQPSYVGQEADIEQQQKEVAAVRSAAQEAPQNRNIYQTILKLSDDTTTGQFTSWLQKNPLIGQIAGDNYQELGKFLEKNALNNMQAMGGAPSDARLSAASAANGSTHFNPKALKAVTQFNYATNTALERYRNGIDQAVGTTNPQYNELPRFKADWAKNFDVDVFRLENAIADGDENAKNEILAGMSKAKAAELVKKMKNLDSLAETGRLPK